MRPSSRQIRTLRTLLGCSIVAVSALAVTACAAEPSDASTASDVTVAVIATDPSSPPETPASSTGDGTASTSSPVGDTERTSVESEPVGEDEARGDLGAVGTLASDAVHEIAVEFDDAAYNAMIETYQTTRDKEWIEATVTIDGVTYERVGMRLKGNSSLQGIAGGGRGGPMGGSASADRPETLPWLVKLDRFVEGQSHDELVELVVRSNRSATALNEAVALELLQMAGLAAQDAIAVSFEVNDSAPLLRLVIDNPDDVWMGEELSTTGALYKAESRGDYSYRGDDADAYDEVFDQEAGKDNADLTPLIGFLEFVNGSDDASFAAELGDRLDIDAFVTYLAMQEVVNNFDDIDGPGNNSYLYYDTDTSQFTVVPWDYNLAFGSGPGGGPGEFPGGPGGFPGGSDVPDPPDAFPAPADLPDGQGPANGPPGGGGPGRGPGRSNVLVERFLAVDDWQQLVNDRVEELRSSLIDTGAASDVLDQWVDVIGASGLVDDATIEAESDALRSAF